MWILVVLSTAYGSDEVKMTHYEAYQTKQACMVDNKKLYKEFKMNEEAMCIRVPSKKPVKVDK